VETILGVGVTAVDEGGVTLSNGQRIESSTVIWTAGMRASPLTVQVPAPRDNLGRLMVDPDLRVPGVKNVFATGDTARVAADSLGNVAPMTCQFAIRLGAFAGHNAAADLLGLPTEPYEQKTYVVCLDLGSSGAIFARGWNPQLEQIGELAKETKRQINTVWIVQRHATWTPRIASGRNVTGGSRGRSLVVWLEWRGWWRAGGRA
jgi:NADH dehydrogenase